MKKGRTLAIGDIHGAYKSAYAVSWKMRVWLSKWYTIPLGDIADGWAEVEQCVDELLKIENLIAIRGNHDEWLRAFFENNISFLIFGDREELGTLKSYSEKTEYVIQIASLSHIACSLKTKIVLYRWQKKMLCTWRLQQGNQFMTTEEIYYGTDPFGRSISFVIYIEQSCFLKNMPMWLREAIWDYIFRFLQKWL